MKIYKEKQKQFCSKTYNSALYSQTQHFLWKSTKVNITLIIHTHIWNERRPFYILRILKHRNNVFFKRFFMATINHNGNISGSGDVKTTLLLQWDVIIWRIWWARAGRGAGRGTRSKILGHYRLGHHHQDASGAARMSGPWRDTAWWRGAAWGAPSPGPSRRSNYLHSSPSARILSPRAFTRYSSKLGARGPTSVVAFGCVPGYET